MEFKRKKENGLLVFHDNTEEILLKYVQENAKDDPEDIIKTIDKFCYQIHWMMNLGDVKAKVLENTYKKYSPKYVLEIGTYCGYSGIFFKLIIIIKKKYNNNKL
jgi:predicted O-methyltransferase YrrM